MSSMAARCCEEEMLIVDLLIDVAFELSVRAAEVWRYHVIVKVRLKR